MSPDRQHRFCAATSRGVSRTADRFGPIWFAAILSWLTFVLATASLPAHAETSEPPLPVLAEIPFFTERNMVVLNLPVAHYQLNMLLDTGASTTALFKSATRRFSDLASTGTTDVVLPIINETVSAETLVSYTIKLGAVDFVPERPLLLDRSLPDGDYLLFRVDGVLGQDFFQEFLVEIDPQARVVRLYQPDADLSDTFKRNVRLHMKGTAPHIRIYSRLPWEDKRSRKEMLFDTGYPGAMIVWSTRQFRMAAGGEGPGKLRSTNTGIATFANFRVGRIYYMQTPIYVSPNEPHQVHERDGLIGASLMSHYHYVIDFPGKRLLLAKNGGSHNEMDPTVYIPDGEDYFIKQYPRKPQPNGSLPR